MSFSDTTSWNSTFSSLLIELFSTTSIKSTRWIIFLCITFSYFSTLRLLLPAYTLVIYSLDNRDLFSKFSHAVYYTVSFLLQTPAVTVRNAILTLLIVFLAIVFPVLVLLIIIKKNYGIVRGKYRLLVMWSIYVTHICIVPYLLNQLFFYQAFTPIWGIVYLILHVIVILIIICQEVFLDVFILPRLHLNTEFLPTYPLTDIVYGMSFPLMHLLRSIVELYPQLSTFLLTSIMCFHLVLAANSATLTGNTTIDLYVVGLVTFIGSLAAIPTLLFAFTFESYRLCLIIAILFLFVAVIVVVVSFYIRLNIRLLKVFRKVSLISRVTLYLPYLCRNIFLRIRGLPNTTARLASVKVIKRLLGVHNYTFSHYVLIYMYTSTERAFTKLRDTFIDTNMLSSYNLVGSNLDAVDSILMQREPRPFASINFASNKSPILGSDMDIALSNDDRWGPYRGSGSSILGNSMTHDIDASPINTPSTYAFTFKQGSSLTTQSYTTSNTHGGDCGANYSYDSTFFGQKSDIATVPGEFLMHHAFKNIYAYKRPKIFLPNYLSISELDVHRYLDDIRAFNIPTDHLITAAAYILTSISSAKSTCDLIELLSRKGMVLSKITTRGSIYQNTIEMILINKLQQCIMSLLQFSWLRSYTSNYTKIILCTYILNTLSYLEDTSPLGVASRGLDELLLDGAGSMWSDIDDTDREEDLSGDEDSSNHTLSYTINANINVDVRESNNNDVKGPDSMHQFFQNQVMQKLRGFVEDTLFINNLTDEANLRADLNLPALRRSDLEFSDNQLFLLYSFSTAMFTLVYSNSSYYRTFFSYHMPEVLQITNINNSHEHENLQQDYIDSISCEAFANKSPADNGREGRFETVGASPSLHSTASSVLSHSFRNPKSVKKMINIIYTRVIRSSMGTMSSTALPWIRMCSFYKHCYEGLLMNREGLLNFGRSSLHRSSSTNHITDVLLLQINYQLERIIFSMFLIHIFLFEVFKRTVFMVKSRPHFCKQGSHYIQYLAAYHRLLDCYQLLNTVDIAPNTRYFSPFINKLIKKRLEMQCRVQLIKLSDVITKNEVYGVLKAIEDLETKASRQFHINAKDSGQVSSSSSGSGTSMSANTGTVAGNKDSSMFGPMSKDVTANTQDFDFLPADLDYFSIHKQFQQKSQHMQQWFQMYDVILSQLTRIYAGPELFATAENLAYLIAQQFKLLSLLYEISQLYYQFILFLIDNFEMEGVKEFQTFCQTNFYEFLDSMMEGGAAKFNESPKQQKTVSQWKPGVYLEEDRVSQGEYDPTQQYGYRFLEENLKLFQMREHIVTPDNAVPDPSTFSKLTNDICFRKGMKISGCKSPHLKVLYAELGSLHHFISPSQDHTICGRMLFKQASRYYKQATEHLFKIKMYAFMISAHIRLNKHKEDPVVSSMFSTISNIYTDFDFFKAMRFLKIELAAYQASLKRCLKLYLTLFQEEPDNPTILVLLETLRYEFDLESLSFYLPLVNFKASMNSIKRRDFHNRTAIDNLYIYLLSFYSTDNIFEIYGPLSKYNCARVTPEYLSTLVHRIDYNSYFYNMLPYSWRKKQLIQYEQACALQVLGAGYFISEQFSTNNTALFSSKARTVHINTLLLDYIISDLRNNSFSEKKKTVTKDFITTSTQIIDREQNGINSMSSSTRTHKDAALAPQLATVIEVSRNTNARRIMHLIKRNGPDLDYYIGVLKNSAESLSSPCLLCRESLLGRCSIHKKIAVLMLKGNGTYAQLFDILKNKNNHRYPLSIHDFFFNDSTTASLNVYVNMPKTETRTSNNKLKGSLDTLKHTGSTENQNTECQNAKQTKTTQFSKSAEQLAYERAEVATRLFDDSLLQVISISSTTHKMQRAQLRFIRICSDLARKATKILTTAKTKHEFDFYFEKIVSVFSGLRNSKYASHIICKLVLLNSNTGTISTNLKTGLYAIYQALNEVSAKIYSCYFPVRFIKGPPALTPQLLPDAPGDVEDDTLVETYTGRMRNNDVKPIAAFKGIDRDAEFNLIQRMRQEYTEFGHFITIFALVVFLLILLFYTWYLYLLKQLSKYVPILKLMGQLLTLSYYRGLYSSVSALPDYVLPVSVDDPVMETLLFVMKNNSNLDAHRDNLQNQLTNNSVSHAFNKLDTRYYSRSYLLSIIAEQYKGYINELTAALLDTTESSPSFDRFTKFPETVKQSTLVLDGIARFSLSIIKEAYAQMLLFMKLYLSHILSALTIVFSVLFRLYIPVAHELEHMIDIFLAACPTFNITDDFPQVYSGINQMNLTPKTYVSNPILLLSCPALQYNAEKRYLFYNVRPFTDIAYSMQPNATGNTFLINLIDYTLLESYRTTSQLNMENRLDKKQYFRQFLRLDLPLFISWSPVSDIIANFGNSFAYTLTNIYTTTNSKYYQPTEQNTYSLLNTITDSDGRSIFAKFVGEINRYQTTTHFQAVFDKGFYKDALDTAQQPFLSNKFQYIYYSSLFDQDTVPSSIVDQLSYDQKIGDILLSFFPGITNFMFYQIPLTTKDVDDYLALSLHSMTEQAIGLSPSLVTIPLAAQFACILFIFVYLIRLFYWLFKRDNNFRYILSNYLINAVVNYGVGGLYDLDNNPVYRKNNVLANHATILFTMKQLLNGSNIGLSSSNISNDYARMQMQSELIPLSNSTVAVTQPSDSSLHCSQSSQSIISVDTEHFPHRVNLTIDDEMIGTVAFKLGASPEDISTCLHNEWRDFNEQTQDVANCSRCKAVIRKQQCGWRFLIGILFFIFWISLAFIDDMRYINQRAYHNDEMRQDSYSYDLATVYALLLRRSSKAMSYVFFGIPNAISEWSEISNEAQFRIETMLRAYPESSSIILKLLDSNTKILNSELRAMGYTLAFMCPDGSFYRDTILDVDKAHYLSQAFNDLFTLYGNNYIQESLEIKFTDTPPEKQLHKTLVSDAVISQFKTKNMSSYLTFDPEFSTCKTVFNSLQPPNSNAYKVVAEAIQMRIIMADIFCQKTPKLDSALKFVYTDCPKKFDTIDQNKIFEYMSAMEYFHPIFDQYAEINKLTFEKESQVSIIKSDRLLTATILCVMLTSIICCDTLFTLFLLRRVFRGFKLAQYLFGVIGAIRWVLEFVVFGLLVADINSLSNLIYTHADSDTAMLMDTMQLYQNLLSDISTLTLLNLTTSNTSQTRTDFTAFHSRVLDLNLTMPLFATEDVRVAPHDNVYTNIIADEGFQPLLSTIDAAAQNNPSYIQNLLTLTHSDATRTLHLYYMIYEYYHHIINSLLRSPIVSNTLPPNNSSSILYLPREDSRLSEMALGLHIHDLDDAKLALVYMCTSLTNTFDMYSTMIKDTTANIANKLDINKDRTKLYSIHTNGNRVLVSNSSISSLVQMTENEIHLVPPYIRILAYIMSVVVLILMTFFMQSGSLIYYEILGTLDLITEGKRYLKPAFIVILSKADNLYKVVSITEIPDSDLYLNIKLTSMMRTSILNEIQKRISVNPAELITDRPDFTSIMVYPDASNMAIAVDYSRRGFALCLRTNSKKILQEYLHKHYTEIKVYPAFVRITFPKHLCSSCLDSLISEIVYLNANDTACSYHVMKHLQCSKAYLKSLPNMVQFIPTGFLRENIDYLYKCAHNKAPYKCQDCIKSYEVDGLPVFHESMDLNENANVDGNVVSNKRDLLDIRTVFEANRQNSQSIFKRYTQGYGIKDISLTFTTSLNKISNIFSRTPSLFQYSTLTIVIYVLFFMLVILTIIFLIVYSIARLSAAEADLQLYSIIAQLLYYARKAVESSFKHIDVISQGQQAALTKEVLGTDINTFSTLINVVSKKIEQTSYKEKIYHTIMKSGPTFTKFIDCTYKIGNHVKTSTLFYHDYITWLSSLGGTLGELKSFLLLLTDYNSRFTKQTIAVSLWMVVIDVIILLILRQLLMWQLNKEVVKVGYIAKLIYK